MLVLAVGTLSATPVACTTAPPVTLATVSNNYMAPPTGSPVVDCGPLEFSNFQAVNQGGAAVGLAFNYVSPSTWDSATGTVSIAFNPFFNVAASPNVEDIHLFFDVTANAGWSIVGVDGSISGTNSSYSEYACAGAGGYAGIGGCTTATLASFSITSGDPATAIMPITASQSLGIYKDILTLGPGHLTGFGQTYEVTGTTPEPATFAMLGGGLVLLAFARRRKKA
jgi:hypothetical protein